MAMALAGTIIAGIFVEWIMGVDGPPDATLVGISIVGFMISMLLAGMVHNSQKIACEELEILRDHVNQRVNLA